MEPSLAMISHIAKDSFDVKSRLDKHCPNGTTLSTCDIKSLYTQPAITCSKLTIETLEQGSVVLVSLLLTLNIFHTLF